MRVRTTIYANKYYELSKMPLAIFHNQDIKKALNTIREKLELPQEDNIFLDYYDNKEEKEVKFNIKILDDENYGKFIGFLEILK